MKNDKKLVQLVLGCLCLLGMMTACGGDDGGSSATSPSTPINVTGTWNFSGQLSSNTCNTTPAQSAVLAIQLFQSGTTVTSSQVVFETGAYFTYRGSVAGNSLNMAAVDPYVVQGGGMVIHMGSGFAIQNIQNNSGSGSFNLTLAYVQGGTGSCQEVWSGSWTKQ